MCGNIFAIDQTQWLASQIRMTLRQGIDAMPMHDRRSIITTQRNRRYREIVDHFEQVARANVGRFVHVADLSRVAGVNQRTLSRAFRDIRGLGPYRYLQYLRLSEVRRVLSSEEGTVTQAAMRFGFRELGRFGVLYRKAFGESPSETKRRRRSVHVISHHDAPSVANDTEEPHLEHEQSR
jgi:transcriptional regulator GlxA family with amidase domain